MKRAFAALALLLAAGAAHAACKVETIAQLRVRMQGTLPLIEAKINGAPATFIADSGAFYSLISPGAAAQFHLHLGAAPFGMTMRGIGGSAALSVAEIRNFTLAGLPVPHTEFFVGGSETGGEAQGYIGRNILSLADVEFDLAGGDIRLMRASGCAGVALAYWAKPPLPFGVVDIEEGQTTPFRPPIKAAASVNGSRIKAIFDTGASGSLLTLSAAKRLGLGPDNPGVAPAGFSGGVGPRLAKTWIAPIDVFEIGGEKIEHTHVRVVDTDLRSADMLLGADFFLSHRVYVANGQHKLYFTYNGGPVFNLTTTSAPAAAQAPTPGASDVAAQPVDAAGFARRAAAEDARRDFPAAVADFGKAMALEPKQPDYPFQRATTHLRAGQPVLAMADLDRTLALAPADARALIARAYLRFAAHDSADALTDLDAADHALPPAANARLPLAELYRLAEAPTRALVQYDLWIKVHPDDRNQPEALSGRCWSRIQLGTDLDKAMEDCQHALRLLPSDWGALDGRAFVRLCQGDLDKAITDFNAAASQRPKDAWPLYGRGLAKLKKGLTTEGKADLGAALALSPDIVKAAGQYGLRP